MYALRSSALNPLVRAIISRSYSPIECFHFHLRQGLNLRSKWSEISMAAKKAILAAFFLFQGLGVVLAETPILVNAKNRVPAYVTAERLHSFIKIRNPHFDPLHGIFSNIAGGYEYWGGMYGIRWDYALFQMLHETNFLMFTGGVRPEHFNLAGIGAIVPGEPGEVFKSLQEGILGHIQHLALYALVDIRDEDLVAHRSRKVKARLQERIERELKGPTNFEDPWP